MKGIITNNQKPIIMKKTLFLSFLFCLLGMSLTFAKQTSTAMPISAKKNFVKK